MPTFDLNQVLSKPQLYTPIDYGNLNISTNSVQKAMNGIKDTIHAFGYKTIEDKEAEQAALAERLYATQKQIQDLGLSEADSPRDFYAVGATPEQLQEWDRGSKLATGVGLGLVSLPYAITALPEIASTIKWGLTTPMGQRSLLKAAASTMAGTTVDNSVEQAKYQIDNSKLGNTHWNKYLFKPVLSAAPWLIDIDGKIIGAVDDVAEAAAKISSRTDNLIYDKSLQQKVAEALPKEKTVKVSRPGKRDIVKTYPYIQSDGVDDLALHWFEMARQKYGDEILVEAFPYHGSDNVARDLYENAMMKQNMFALNGTHMPLSEDEIISLATARQSGYGNDGQIFARAMAKSEIPESKTDVYTALFEPGIVDKYLIVPRGYTMQGYPNISGAEIQTMVELQAARKKAESLIEEGLRSGDKQKTIAGLRALQYTKGRTPTLMEQHNMATGYKNGQKVVIDPSTLSPAKKAEYDAALKVGKNIVDRMKSSSYDEALEGGAPLIGLTREIEEMPVYKSVEKILEDSKKPTKVKEVVHETRGVYPIVTRDNANIIGMPSTNGVMALQKHAEPFDEYLKRVAEVDPHLAREMGIRAEILGLTKATPDAIIKTISPSEKHGWKGLAAGTTHLIPDGTHGSGQIPTMSIADTGEGQFKVIGPASTNTFDGSPGLKFGGKFINSLNPTIKQLLNI